MREAFAVDEVVWGENPDPCWGEKELLRQLIIRAIQDATGNVGIEYGDIRVEIEALDWIFSNQGVRDTHVTFLWACDVLEVDPDALRALVNDAREDDLRLKISDLSTRSVSRTRSFTRPRIPTK